MDRLQLKAMLEFAREGDTIVVESFSRLSRLTKDLLHFAERMHEKVLHLNLRRKRLIQVYHQGNYF